MQFFDLVNQLIVDTKGVAEGWAVAPDSSVRAFLPEITICLTILVMLFVRLFRWGDSLDRFLSRFLGGGTAFYIALIGTALALVASAPGFQLSQVRDEAAWAMDPASAVRMEIFTGMLVYDTFTVFVRCLLFVFILLFLVFTRLTQIPDRDDAPDIYTLVLGATLGMCLMASANHLLMVFLGVEMASVPSYALAGMLKGRRVSSEAALKYAVYGAGAAGVMLYGISLIAGILNTAHLPTLAVQLAQLDVPEIIRSGQGTEQLLVLAMGGLMLLVGVAFKLSAVPFHFWCPDVFEGAAAEIGAFLSVASKAAALALLVRVAIGFSAIPGGTAPFEEPLRPGARTAMAERAEDSEDLALFSVADTAVAADVEAEDAAASAASQEGGELSRAEAMARLQPVRHFAGRLIALMAIVTCTFGNLAAYGQTNIKRLLAYSTIAHAGYMIMAVSPLIALAEIDSASAERAVAGIAIYLVVYLFMNLGAFAVVAFLRNEMRSEELADYAGLIRQTPILVVCFSIMLFSLVGLPPLAGFIGKFAVFAALADGYRLTNESYLLTLLVVGCLNTAISLFYYLRVVKVMTMEAEPDQRLPVRLPWYSIRGAYIALLTLPLVLLIVGWDWVSTMALAAAKYLLV